MKDKLLTRDEFREAVFKRDKHRCVNCGVTSVALDAHHILERRLWPDGGYYLNNGVALCDPNCHMLAEQTVLSCDELRNKAGIKTVLLPPHLSIDENWDKWGNPILDNGTRLPGELFYDESVQLILKPVLNLFGTKVKFPRTFHLPWSPGLTSDDKVLESLRGFEGEEVVVTAKFDGENTSVYKDGVFHARSLNSGMHPSRTWMAGFAASIGNDIPEGYRLCGENLYAKHSIQYNNLRNYFLLFSVWKQNICLSWDETLEWSNLLDIPIVTVLYRGLWNEELVRKLYIHTLDGDPCEGYVVRVTRELSYSEYRRVVGKYVRASHVQTDQHWMHGKVIPNKLVG